MYCKKKKKKRGRNGYKNQESKVLPDRGPGGYITAEYKVYSTIY
jgi:hypothetical protein